MARPTRRARERRHAHPGWRVTPLALAAVVAVLTITTFVVGPITAGIRIATEVANNAAATGRLARSLEKLEENFQRVIVLERDIAVLKAKVGVE